MNEVLLIGGSGFVGSHLMSVLSTAGAKTVAPSSKELDMLAPEAPQTLQRLISSNTTIVFLAALTPDRGKDGAAMEKNIKMALNLAAAVESTQPKHLILISSDAVYPDNLAVIDESSPTDSGNLYGLGHSAREKVIQDVAGRRKIPLLILRPSAIFGPGDTHNSYGPNRFIRSALKDGEIKLFGEGKDLRDHLFVEDFARVIQMCIEKNTVGVLNITSGQAVSFFHVAQQVQAECQIAGRTVKITTAAPTNPTFRHFNPTARMTALPELGMTKLADAISETLRAGLNAKPAQPQQPKQQSSQAACRSVP